MTENTLKEIEIYVKDNIVSWIPREGFLPMIISNYDNGPKKIFSKDITRTSFKATEGESNFTNTK